MLGTSIRREPNLIFTLDHLDAEKDRMKKARLAENARQRYEQLSPEGKKEFNLKRTMAKKRRRQREKELEELDAILKETHDIQPDSEILEQLREKRKREKWSESARARYARMTPAERTAENARRRQRKMQNALAAVQAAGGSGDPQKDAETAEKIIKKKKAQATNRKYHSRTLEEKRIYNQNRNKAVQRKRKEEQKLLNMPPDMADSETLEKVQQIIAKNEKRAEAARASYRRRKSNPKKPSKKKEFDDDSSEFGSIESSLLDFGGSEAGSIDDQRVKDEPIEDEPVKGNVIEGHTIECHPIEGQPIEEAWLPAFCENGCSMKEEVPDNVS